MEPVRRYFAVVYASIFILGGSVSSFAEQLAASPAQPKALDTLIQARDLTLIKRFDTDTSELKGYVLKDKSGKYGIVYSVQDVLLLGKIMGADGAMLSEKYAAENMPKPDFSAAAKFLESDKYLVTEGKKGAPVMYVFADPNCIFCHQFYDRTRDWVAQGKVQLRWVMVGFLKPSSAGRAAAIMAAKDRVKANAQDHDKFDAATEEGSIAQLESIPKALQDSLKNHETLMTELQFQGTPGLIYKDKDSHWQGTAGMPPVEQLASALGISN